LKITKKSLYFEKWGITSSGIRLFPLFSFFVSQERVVVEIEEDSVHHLSNRAVKKLNVRYLSVTLIFQDNWKPDLTL